MGKYRPTPILGPAFTKLISIQFLPDLVGGHESLHGVGARRQQVLGRGVVLGPVGHRVPGIFSGIGSGEDRDRHHHHSGT